MLRHRAAIWTMALALAGAALAVLLAACADDIPEAPQQQALRSAPAESDTQQQALRSAPAESDTQQQARPSDDEPADDQSEPPTQLETIQALNADWSARLTSFEMRLSVATEVEDFTFDQSIFLQAQLEPLQLYMEIDIGDLVGAITGPAEDADSSATDEPAADEPPLPTIRMLLLDDRAYLSLSEEGWAAVPSDELFGANLSALTGGLSDDAADAMTAQANLALLCAELIGGSVLEDELDGAPVWIVSCDVDADAMAAILDAMQLLGQAALPAGLPADQALDAIEALSYTVHISQNDGALLAFNVALTLNGDLLSEEQTEQAAQDPQSAQAVPGIGRMTVATTGRLTAWNQPINFPTPEPLLEEDSIYE